MYIKQSNNSLFDVAILGSTLSVCNCLLAVVCGRNFLLGPATNGVTGEVEARDDGEGAAKSRRSKAKFTSPLFKTFGSYITRRIHF